MRKIVLLTLAFGALAAQAVAQTGDVVIPNLATPKPHVEFYPPQRTPMIAADGAKLWTPSCHDDDDCKCLGRAFYVWLVHHDPSDPRYRASAVLEYPCTGLAVSR